MTTLEARYASRIGEFRARAVEVQDALRSAAPGSAEHARLTGEAARAAEEEVQYMLGAAPFIREYMSDDAAAADGGGSGSGGGGSGGGGGGSGAMERFVTVTSKSSRHAVLQRYLVKVEKDIEADPYAYVDRSDRETVCQMCDVPLVVDKQQSMFLCPSCARVTPYVGLSEANLSYQEEVSQDRVSNFSYKRLNHFSEWLNSIQAKASTEISEEVIEAIKAEFKKSRTSTRKDITPTKVRTFMKKLNMNKLYEHAHHVCQLISGTPAPRLDPELEVQLKTMFCAIQQPFERAIKDTPRRNFLSYSYVLFKMCELLGHDELLCHFRLLKSPQKLFQQDVIWKCICAELSWQFISSV